MATELSSFAELKKAAPTGPGTQIAAAHREKEIDAQGRAYATGRRKNAVARVWVKPGTGKITINGRDQKVYFARPTQQMVIQQPFDVTQRREQFDVIATVSGGGLSGQAGAVRHGISQALAKYEPDLRSAMKQSGFLTRDSRVVERKKYGRAGARRRFLFCVIASCAAARHGAGGERLASERGPWAQEVHQSSCSSGVFP